MWGCEKGVNFARKHKTKSQMGEEEKEQGKLQGLAERVRKRHPDTEWEDEDAMYGQFGADYDEDQAALEGYRQNEKDFADMFANDPRSAEFFADMHNGRDPLLGLVARYGEEIRDILDDPERQAELAEAQREYVERVTRNRQLEQEYKENLAESMRQLDAVQEQLGLSDDEVDQAMSLLVALANDAVVGKFSPETIEMAAKALRHDQDVASARQEGEIAGRNAKIDEELKRPEQGDGMPRLSGTSEPPAQKQGQSIFDLASQA